jgi:hypothetical protein
MLDGTTQGAGYRSFSDWAKRTLDPTPEAMSEKPAVEQIEESIKQEPEPTQEQLVEEYQVTEKDVVQTLLEKLSDFGWEESVLEVRTKPKEKLPDLEEIAAKVEEKLEALIKEKEKREVEAEEEKPKEPKLEKKKEPVHKKVEEGLIEEEITRDYKIFKDRDENFECQLSVEGTSLNDARVRIVLESDAWNFVFYGKVYGDGKCVVPIKKGLPLMEGARGNIKLEVIAEDQLFIGWEDNFKVIASKKVKVELKEQKSVRVSFNNSINENSKA